MQYQLQFVKVSVPCIGCKDREISFYFKISYYFFQKFATKMASVAGVLAYLQNPIAVVNSRLYRWNLTFITDKLSPIGIPQWASDCYCNCYINNGLG